MTPVETQLRDYFDFVETQQGSVDVRALVATGERAAQSVPTARRISTRRGLLVAAAALVVVLVIVGGAALLMFEASVPPADTSVPATTAVPPIDTTITPLTETTAAPVPGTTPIRSAMDGTDVWDPASGVFVPIPTIAVTLANQTSLRDPPDAPGERALPGTIAFVSSTGPLIVREVDGSERNLTQGELPGRTIADPAWSPDGLRIAFVASTNQRGPASLFVAAADGSQLTRITDGADGLSPPHWSPDGSHIAFAQLEAGVFTVEPDGSNLVTLVAADRGGEARTTPRSLHFNEHSQLRASWSPDGERIAFIAGPGWGEVHVVDADGGMPERITNLVPGGVAVETIEWSPNGNKIVMTTSAFHLLVINADGSGLSRYEFPEDASVREVGRPAWSPDGRRILFSSFYPDQGGEFTINVMDADGSSLTRLDPPNSTEWQPLGPSETPPQWSPDGTHVAVVTVEGILILEVDGPGTSWLTETGATQIDPAWAPQP